MSDEFTCGTCWKDFTAGWEAREQHLNATGHCEPEFECDTCARHFGSEQARWQHMNDKNHFEWECRHCGDTWPSESGRDQHEREEHTGRRELPFECDTCDRRFGSDDARWQHMNDKNHFYWECRDEDSDCGETYPTKQERDEHEQEEHLYCGECDRYFDNYNNIKMHLNSRRHRGSEVICPFCKSGFATAAGLTHHVENSSCPNARGLNRDTLYKYICSKDPGGLITKKLLEWHGSSEYEASDRSWNPNQGWFECYLCHRGFQSLNSLNQHLNSPTHKEDLYHCSKGSCGREFKTLAGIVSHLESESCGCMRFEKVQQGIQDVVSRNKQLTFGQ